MLKNPILIVDDDQDDLELIKDAINSLGLPNETLFFHSGNALKDHLLQATVSPFMILCDVNLPGHSGFEIRKSIADNKEIRYKSVPFIFWSTTASEKQIQEAYDLPAQGFFFKATTFDELCSTLKIIPNYWTVSQHPKSVT